MGINLHAGFVDEKSFLRGLGKHESRGGVLSAACLTMSNNTNI